MSDSSGAPLYSLFMPHPGHTYTITQAPQGAGDWGPTSQRSAQDSALRGPDSLEYTEHPWNTPAPGPKDRLKFPLPWRKILQSPAGGLIPAGYPLAQGGEVDWRGRTSLNSFIFCGFLTSLPLGLLFSCPASFQRRFLPRPAWEMGLG